MAVVNDVTTLNGLFKTVYADSLIDLVPDFAIMQKRVDFIGADKELGGYYSQPVNLNSEQGFTYGGNSGASFSLNAAVAGALSEAQVKGSSLVLRSQMGYDALSRASKAGTKAFKRLSGWLVENMNASSRKRIELGILYGQMGLGKVSANNSGVLTLTDASWSGGIWAGLEGAVLESWTGTTSSETQQNGDLVISAVDADNKAITVTGTNSSVTTNSVLYFKGARTASAFNEQVGLQKILQNTGTLFNISASTYSLWKGTSVSSAGQPSQGKMQDWVSKAVSKGLMEKTLTLVSPKCWAVLNADQAALRVYDSSYKSGKGENAFEALQFHGTNGINEVISHPFVKDGDLFIVPPDSLMRIGSSDLTFGVPGMDEQFFTLVSGTAAVEIQCYCDQAVFMERPAHGVFVTGLTYT